MLASFRWGGMRENGDGSEGERCFGLVGVCGEGGDRAGFQPSLVGGGLFLGRRCACPRLV